VVTQAGMVTSTILLSSSNNAYEITRVLKNAIFGQVHHGLLLDENTAVPGTYVRRQPFVQVALKVYSRQRLRELQGMTQENPLTEIAAMQYLGSDHPFVMGQLECCMDADNVYSVMRFCDGGELYDVIEEEGALDEPRARVFFSQVVEGVRRLHSQGVAHRDLSLENILYSATTNTCQIIDFGMCLRMPQDGQTGVFHRITAQPVCGKKNYIAPEVIEQVSPFDPMRSDIWALGVILFIILTGYPPVDMANPLDERFRLIANNQLDILLESWGFTNLSPEAVELMTRILRVDPDERLTLEGIVNSSWLNIPPPPPPPP